MSTNSPFSCPPRTPSSSRTCDLCCQRSVCPASGRRILQSFSLSPSRLASWAHCWVREVHLVCVPGLCPFLLPCCTPCMSVSQFAMHPTAAGCFGCSWRGAAANGASEALCGGVMSAVGSSVLVCTHAFACRARRGIGGPRGRGLCSSRRGNLAVRQGGCTHLPARPGPPHPTASSCTPLPHLAPLLPARSSHTFLLHWNTVRAFAQPCPLHGTSFSSCHAAAFFPFTCHPLQG